GYGRIVNCSSILGLVPVKYRGAYAASKHALEGLTLCLRAELAATGIKVSLIEPGPVVSKIAANGLPWFLKHVDIEGSPHRDAYEAQLARMEAGGSVSRWKPGPHAVHRVLRHALNSPRPKPHYVMTLPARAGVFIKRFLPPALAYRITAGQG
ncbi:MAG: SDR family NAD(P)-dependent oxidoreductase, partial [Notoacmeibacter sp.]|nr:SDR family NAD(P)-dependent oxidoreductase [Notoacmeibacter sp.]